MFYRRVMTYREAAATYMTQDRLCQTLPTVRICLGMRVFFNRQAVLQIFEPIPRPYRGMYYDLLVPT